MIKLEEHIEQPSKLSSNSSNAHTFIPSQQQQQPQHEQSTEHITYLELVRKNILQITSISPGVILLLISGLHIGWGIWRTILPYLNVSLELSVVILSSWYIGAIVGSIVSAILLNRVKKKTIYYIGGSSLAISSVVIIVWFDNYFEAILVCRLLAGIGHGLIYITTIIHASENVIKEMRGRLLSLINFVMIATIFLSTLLYVVNSSKNNDLIIGILGLVFAVVALLLTPLMPYESIVFLLRRGEDRKALANLLKLRGETSETAVIQSELQDLTNMLEQDKIISANIFVDRNVRPLFLVTIMRVMAILANNIIINTVMIAGTHVLLLHHFEVNENALILASIRFAVSFVPLIWSDSFLHKTMLNYSTVVSSSFTLLVGIMMVAIAGHEIIFYFALFFFVQAFSSVGIDPMQHIIMSEAFSTAKKPWSITFVTTIEHILQIVVIVVFSNVKLTEAIISGVVIGAGVTMVLFAFMFNTMLPETSGLTLMGCRDAFLKRRKSSEDG